MAGDEQQVPPEQNILGLKTSELAGLSVDDLLNNKSCIIMIMHFFRQLLDENMEHKNTINTLRTYKDTYDKKSSDIATSGVLLAGSNVLVGFGVNLLTNSTTPANAASWWPGLVLLVCGVGMIGTGLYFAYR